MTPINNLQGGSEIIHVTLRIHQLFNAMGEESIGLLHTLDPPGGEFTSLGLKYSVANLHD